MNPIDRVSFDAFCVALQSFPCRLAERPHGTPFLGMATAGTNGSPRGKAFVNTRRRNFWSVVHIDASIPVHSGVDRGDIGGGKTAAYDVYGFANFDAVKALHSREQVIIHRFQLCYADIPIEPVIEVAELLANTSIEATPETALDIDARWFNKRVADAVRAVLGGTRMGEVRHAVRRKGKHRLEA